MGRTGNHLMPSWRDHEAFSTQQGALVALLTGTGGVVLQDRDKRGFQVPRIENVPLRSFIPHNASTLEIERLALRLGHDSAVGCLMRRLLSEGHSLGEPALDAWMKQAMRPSTDEW